MWVMEAGQSIALLIYHEFLKPKLHSESQNTFKKIDLEYENK